MTVLNALTDKPKTRQQLAQECGISDRSLRREIKRLRDNGYPICTNSQTGGYWIGNNKESAILARELWSRAIELMTTARAISSGALDGQEEWKW